MQGADPDLYPNVMAEREVEALAKIIRQRGEVKDIGSELFSLPDFVEAVPIGMRKKSKRRGPLSLQEKVGIAHKVLIQFKHQKDVAKEYRVGQSVITKLIKKARSNAAFFEELMAKDDAKDRKKKEAMEVIKGMITNNVVIDSAEQVTGKLNRKLPHDYKRHQVRRIMKDDMGMRYRRIQVVALHTNSEKNRILRQRFAIELVTLLNQGKRIINVDESWFNMCDFRRMKWRAYGDNNSLAKTQVSPRISMIVGIETTGAVYLSLL